MRKSVNEEKLNAWLAARPPTTILTLADRLLAASVLIATAPPTTRHKKKPDAARALADRCRDDVFGAALLPMGAHHLVSLCVLCAVYEAFGHDVAPLRLGIARHQRVTPAPTDEPFRAVAAYWLWRAGLARGFEVGGAIPADRRLAFSLHIHRVLFAAHYGKSPTDDVAAAFGEAVALCDVDDADSVALVLLGAACHEAAPDTAVWDARLAALQNDDGGFVTAVDDDAARHHAACVTSLVLGLRRNQHAAGVGEDST